MDWKICAVDDLRRYRLIKAGLLNSEDRLSALSAFIKSRRAAKKPQGRRDAELADAVLESKLLHRNIAVAQSTVNFIERGLAQLTEPERAVLDMFYICDGKKSAYTISKELGYSTRSLYRERDRALEKFTLAMYGVEQA
ncbi:MAG: hypothetical protein IJ299_06200 [Oscillospiraceae bacterium]|nr:hypothetical protein [Oscillospiraceae bacterium]